MRKFSPHLFLIVLTLIGVTAFAVPHTAHAVSFDIAGMLFGSMDVLYGVIGKVFWWGLIPLLGVVMGLLGGIVDMALAISFSASFYNTPAIAMAWAILRDLANMIFIFILIYEGIRTILNIGNMTTVKKTIATVVIAALLLNFSLFFTKVIIDASNVAASWFAQGIMNVGGGNSVSDSIRAALQMESLVSQNQTFDGKTLSLQMFTVGFLLTIIQCVAIYVFFKVAFLIVGRIVAFMVLLITSPLGFVGMFVGTIPELSNYAKKWWKELNGQALMLPLFFLMVYITLFIVDRVGVFIADATAGGSGYNSQSAGDPTYYVMFIIIIMLLLRSLKTAEEYSGEIGNMVAGYMKSATGIALGGVSAMGGVIGRQTLGRYGLSIAEDKDKMKALQAKASTSLVGRMQLAAVNKAASSSFDARAAKVGGMDIGSAVFGGFNPKLKMGGVSIDATKVGKTESGGFKAGVDKFKEDEKKWAEKNLGKGKDGEINRMKYAEKMQDSWINNYVFNPGIRYKDAYGDITDAAYKAYAKAETDGVQKEAQKIKNEIINTQIAMSNLTNASKLSSVAKIDDVIDQELETLNKNADTFRKDKGNEAAYNRHKKEEWVNIVGEEPERWDEAIEAMKKLDEEFETLSEKLSAEDKEALLNRESAKRKKVRNFENYVNKHTQNLKAIKATEDMELKKQKIEESKTYLKDERIGKPGKYNKENKEFEGGKGLSEELRIKKKELQDKKDEQALLEGKAPKGGSKPPKEPSKDEDEGDDEDKS